MFRFENIAAFQFLWAIPVLIILRMIYQRLFKKKIESAIGSRMYPFLTKSVSTKKKKNQRLVFLLCNFIFCHCPSKTSIWCKRTAGEKPRSRDYHRGRCFRKYDV